MLKKRKHTQKLNINDKFLKLRNESEYIEMQIKIDHWKLLYHKELHTPQQFIKGDGTGSEMFVRWGSAE